MINGKTVAHKLIDAVQVLELKPVVLQDGMVLIAFGMRMTPEQWIDFQVAGLEDDPA